MVKSIILLAFFLVGGTKSFTNPQGPTIIEDYTKCLIQLLNSEFNKPGILVFANTIHASTPVLGIRRELLRFIHVKLMYSVQVSSSRSDVAICDKEDEKEYLHNFDAFEAVPLADYFIIIVDNYNDFTYLGSKLIRSRSWNPLAKFIVLLLNFGFHENVNVQNVEDILSCMFRYNVINIVVIVPQTNQIRNSHIYSWSPYDPPKYCGYSNETAYQRLVKDNVCQRGSLQYDRRLFKNKVPANMTGCTLNIIALERQPFVSEDENESNIEKQLINEIAQTFKYKVNYKIIHSFRGERNDGRWSGALKELVFHKGDVLIGGIFPDNDVHEDFDCSSAYLADSYTWVVPKAHPSQRWIALIIIFKKSVWLIVIIVFFICVFVWNILGKVSGDTVRNRTIIHDFLSTWICSLGFCTYLRPKKESLRLFFVFLNLYCMMCLTGYQTKLIDVLRNPTFEYQIKNVEELIMSDLKFGGFQELHDLFYNSTDRYDFQFGEKWVDIENISAALIDVAVHRNFSLLCSRLELAHISSQLPELSDSFGNYKYYAFDINVFTVPMEMVAMKGFSFLNKFSHVLSIFKQAGVNSGVRRHFAASNTLKRMKLLRTIENNKPNVDALSLQHLQGGFLALSFGCILGTVSFIIEVFMNTNLIKRKIFPIIIGYSRKLKTLNI